MLWQVLPVFEPALPQHCSPESDFLYRFSSTFHTCVPTDLAFISTTLGTLSIISWLCAQLPQIYKNYSLKSTSGLSIYFLTEWWLGDLSNLLGAIFTRQATWQTIIASYYCFVDLMLVLQWLWYEHLRHGNTIRRVWPRRKEGDGGHGHASDDMQEVVIEGVPALSRQNTSLDGANDSSSKSFAKDIENTRGKMAAWRMPNFVETDENGEEKPVQSPNSGRIIYRSQASSSFPSPSPRTVLFLACLVSLARASPLQSSGTVPHEASVLSMPLEIAGTILSWISTLLYLGSRIPQLYKNYKRQSTSGLSAGLFVAAFFGNMFYSTSILTNPNLYHSAPAYGNGGWAGKGGNDATAWMLNALPFWLGAAGVLGLDAAVGIQFMTYGESEDTKVVVLEDGSRRWRWRRVSGWMRGWVPSFNEPGKSGIDEQEEQRSLLTCTAGRDIDGGYGTTASGAA